MPVHGNTGDCCVRFDERDLAKVNRHFWISGQWSGCLLLTLLLSAVTYSGMLRLYVSLYAPTIFIAARLTEYDTRADPFQCNSGRG